MKVELYDWQYDLFLGSKAKFNILPAGRRSGKTKAASIAAIISASQGEPCLWVDTVYTNIDRYVERYFLEDLKRSDFKYSWNAQKKVLKVEGGYIDFRSADRPESIEGFGYKKIYLNEAGIILNNDYLFTNTILPMLMDHEGSQLYAFGTPKGQVNKKGDPHRFYTLWLKVLDKDVNYFGLQTSSHANPRLSESDLMLLIKEMQDISPEAVRQEIYGEFIAGSSERVFNFQDLDYFKMLDLNSELREVGIAAIDPADEGTDAFSMPIGELHGTKIFIVDWLFTKENTNYTLPAAAAKMRKYKLEYCAIETNNHGSVIHKEIEQDVIGTSLLPVHNSTKKHSRIIQNAGFIKDHFVFRDDYEPDSDYGKAMREVFAYLKDGKAKHEDAPDSLALLAAVVRDMYGSVWYL